MILFFDCETSGLQRAGLPWNDPAQPHLVQIAAKLVTPAKRVVGRMTIVIKPDGWTIEPGAFAVHGISEADAVRHGVSLVAALALFRDFAGKAQRIVAHHVQYDRGLITASLERLGAEGVWWKRCGPKFYCTMEEATPVLQLPGEYGFKFPSLDEAHRFFYPALPFAARHDAEYDVDACERVYWALTEGTNAP